MKSPQQTHKQDKTPCLESQPSNQDIYPDLEIRTRPVIRRSNARAAGLNEAGENIGEDEDTCYSTGWEAGEDFVVRGREDGPD